MREKLPRTVLTFSTTADAMAMEAAAKDFGLPGRMIPVPSEIDAGCGLSWSANADDRKTLEARIAEFGLAHEGLFEVLMY